MLWEVLRVSNPAHEVYDDLSRERIVQILREHLPDLRTRYGVKRIALYGSFARGEGKPSSDIDLLVELTQPLGLQFIALANEVESLLGRKVDIATLETFHHTKDDSRKQHIAAAIERDLVYVE